MFNITKRERESLRFPLVHFGSTTYRIFDLPNVQDVGFDKTFEDEAYPSPLRDVMLIDKFLREKKRLTLSNEEVFQYCFFIAIEQRSLIPERLTDWHEYHVNVLRALHIRMLSYIEREGLRDTFDMSRNVILTYIPLQRETNSPPCCLN